MKEYDLKSPFERKRPSKFKCRFCGKACRALNNNGVLGPGYCEWNYACESCGKIQ